MDSVKRSVVGSCGQVVINVIVAQIERQNEAARRIKEEGIVVRDMKGSVIEHPAIKIELAAAKMISDLMKQWGRG